jgi:dTDP-glucose 4,6-dehydratase/UDP-glucose 4-epimerase
LPSAIIISTEIFNSAPSFFIELSIFGLVNLLPFQLLQHKKILITGGLGFIGSNLARKLLQVGAEVTIVDAMIPSTGANEYNIRDIKGNIEVHVERILDQELISSLIRGKDLLFNLAGMTSHMDSMTDPVPDLENNVTTHLSILNACLKVNPGIKIIYTGTRQIYGKPVYLPVDEAHPVIPVDLNGVHKAAGEMYHSIYHDYHGLRTVIFRLINTYGPGMRIKDARQTFLGIWIRRILEGEMFEVYGTGEQKRDFNYVDDVVDALLLAAENDKAVGKIFNLGSPERISLVEVARMLSDICNKKTYKIVPFPSGLGKIDIGDYYGDIRAASSELGWFPAISLKSGLQKTLDYYSQCIQFYI